MNIPYRGGNIADGNHKNVMATKQLAKLKEYSHVHSYIL